MPAVEPKRQIVRFGNFELDLVSRELRKQGVKIKLQEQPFQILEILLERTDGIVSREEIQKRIWPADTFVDFDKGLYNAIKKLREALGDTAGTPRFIETIPKRGYRFIAPINGATRVIPISVAENEPVPEKRRDWNRKRIATWSVALFAFALLGSAIWRGRVAPAKPRATPALSPLRGAFSVSPQQLHGGPVIFYRGADANLYQLVWPWNPTQWSQLTGQPGRPRVAQGSGIASYENTINRQPEVFYLAEGRQHVEQILILGLLPADLNAATGAPAAVAGSDVVGFIDECAQTDNIFYIGTDRHVHLLLWSKGMGWTTQDLTSLTHDHEAAGTRLVGHIQGKGAEVFHFQEDGHVHEFWRWSGCPASYAFDGWHNTDVTLSNNNGSPEAAADSGLSGYYDQANDSDSLYYIDVQNHLRELLNFKGTWNNVDLTSVAGAPKPGVGDFVSQLSATSQSVYFVDGNQNLRVVKSRPTAPNLWTDPLPNSINLLSGPCLGSGAPPVPPASGAPLAASLNPVWISENVYYLGTDQHIYEFEHRDDEWSCTDITKTATAPNALP
jgi:DNA-binding winged helix-turn-helix (wHTH) protein